MTHLTIETLVCTCGKSLRIETDDQEYLKKKKAEFEKKHGNCNLLPAEPGQAAQGRDRPSSAACRLDGAGYNLN